mmetsp:Transcript_1179/g.1342  ORF Transcript_1179/g.1342 Transcript_1179/m.1342 type:complete len:127 (+) Transcript_1179:264-644(+)
MFSYDSPNPEQTVPSTTEELVQQLPAKSQASVEKRMILMMRWLILLQLIDFTIYSILQFIIHLQDLEFVKNDVTLTRNKIIIAFELAIEMIFGILMASALVYTVRTSKLQLTRHIVVLVFVRMTVD